MASVLRIEIKGIPEVKQLLQNLLLTASFRTELHKRWAIQGDKWVFENFRKEGALTGTPWAKLKPSTIAGRRKNSSMVLQDTGSGLRASFHATWDSSVGRIGSASILADYHETGRKGPWKIFPVRAKVLAFAGASATGKGKKGNTVFARSVTHPGYPARRMLPKSTDSSFTKRIVTATSNFVRQRSKSIGKA